MSRYGSLFQSQLLLVAACLVLASVDATFLNPLDFITKTCQSTRASRFCLRSLTPFAATIKTDQVQACEVAFDASYKVARRMSHSLTKLARQVNASKTADAKVVEALNFCVVKHKDAVMQLNFTITKQLGQWMESEDAQGHLDDLDMNIALVTSYMGECTSEWDALPNDTIKLNVVHRSHKVGAVAGMALDLLRSLEKGVQITESIPPPANCRDCVCCADQKVLPGQCCQCCDAPALPPMAIDNEELADNMCGKKDLACRKWVIESN